MDEVTEEVTGEKSPEYWILAFRNILDNALSLQIEDIEDMCNAIKTSSPETIEMSQQQHIETMAKITELLNALNVGLKAFYVLIVSLVGLGLIGLGTVLFTASVLLAK